MKKAQSLIYQFVIFFVMGFGLFVSIGLFFRVQSDTFRADVVNSSLGLTANYFSSAVISAVDTCKQCDFVRFPLKIENMTAGYFFEIGFDRKKGMNISAVPGDKTLISTVYNLNQSYNMIGKVASAKPITLTFRRTKNELRVE